MGAKEVLAVRTGAARYAAGTESARMVRVLTRLNGAGNREAPRTLGARHARDALYYDRSGYARVAVHAPHGRQSRSAMPPFGTKGSQVSNPVSPTIEGRDFAR